MEYGIPVERLSSFRCLGRMTHVQAEDLDTRYIQYFLQIKKYSEKMWVCNLPK